jgi:type I restriction-modification system DNA methylase subunit
MEGEEEKILPVLRRILSKNWSWLKVFPTPENIRRLFSLGEKALKSLREALEEGKEDRRILPLYNAYKEIISTLYSRAGEDTLRDLFVRHTLMQMTVLACLSSLLGEEGDPIDICSGTLLDTNIALPYLNWWKYMREHAGLRRLAADISVRSGLIDWEFGTEEDVFRELYEVLVEPEVRRSIGEYYTPVWLCDFLLRKFRLEGRLVLDPFCGSGTFLVTAFHRKVEEGRIPDRLTTR